MDYRVRSQLAIVCLFCCFGVLVWGFWGVGFGDVFCVLFVVFCCFGGVGLGVLGRTFLSCLDAGFAFVRPPDCECCSLVLL